MDQNIVVIALGVIVAAAGIWVWWYENRGPEKKDEPGEDDKQ